MRISRLKLGLLAFLAACAVTASTAARGQDAPIDQPILMLDSGGHQALIRSITFTLDGKYLVSAGDDKVIRIWDWQAGKTVRTIRGQVAPGDEGKIYAMALSPNGRWLAVGGWMGPNDNYDLGDLGRIRLYDFASGTLRALLKGHRGVVEGLAFSPDSKHLLSGENNNTAIIWDVDSVQLLHTFRGHQAQIFGVSFTPDSLRAVTASDDKTLRLWNATDGALIKEMRGHGGMVRRVAVSPKDGAIASGDTDGEIRLWDGATGEPRGVFAQQGGNVGSLHFSPDGSLLLATCGTGCDLKQRVFDVASGKELTDYAKHDNIVIAAAFSPDGQLVATGGGNSNEIHIWDPRTGETKAILKGTGQSVFAAAFSTDGRQIAWGQTGRIIDINNRGPLEMTLRLPDASEAIGEPSRVSDEQHFIRAPTSFGAFTLRHRAGGPYGRAEAILEILQNGEVKARIVRDQTNGIRHRAYSFAPDGQIIISGGTSGVLTAYSLDGKTIGNFVGHESEVWAAAVSPDSKYLVSGSDDQTVRLWDVKTRALLVTLFYGSDGEWVMWTPEGYYTSSPHAESIVGWQINKGPDQAADYVSANQLRSHFYRPDIVSKAITLASSKAAIAQSAGTEFSLANLLKRRPPVFAIASPLDGGHTEVTPAEIRLQIEPNEDLVDVIEVLVNGRQVTSTEMRGLSRNFVAVGTPDRQVEVPLELGENKIRIVVRNKTGQTVREFVLFHDKPGPLNAKGTLNVLAIGIDEYPSLPKICGPNRDQACNLRYAAKDAQAFRDALMQVMGGQFKNVKTRLLTRDGDKQPTKATIEDALGEMQRQAGPEDTTVLFISGHGVNDPQSGKYLYLPQDAELAGDSWRASTVLPWIALQDALQQTKGLRLMFVDTCHSGGAYNARLVNDANNDNIVVFSASDARTLSWEYEQLAHGAFTYALIRGLKGEARASDGTVTILGLGAYVFREVVQLTGQKQRPMFNISGAPDIMLAQK